MKDFVIYTLPGLLSASKRSDYREKCRNQAQHLLRFLVDNGLFQSERVFQATDDLVIMASDLTEEGLATMREGLRKWVAAQDRGASTGDTTILHAALIKVRGE